MVKSILAWFDKFQFVLNISLVILFLKGPDDTISLVSFISFRISKLNKILEVHLCFLSSNKTPMHFYNHWKF